MEKSERARAAKNETKLDLEGDRIIVITRRFDGPARVVFDAWTKPEFVRRWWAPASHGVVVVSCDADVRVGGRYRYVLQAGGQQEIAFSGEYREIAAPTRLVYTQVFEPMADAGAVLVTITFDEQEGKTLLVAHELYPSAEARQGALASGMEHGLRETLEQLDQLVGTLR